MDEILERLVPKKIVHKEYQPALAGEVCHRFSCPNCQRTIYENWNFVSYIDPDEECCYKRSSLYSPPHYKIEYDQDESFDKYNFCHTCGQKLDWREYPRRSVVY